MKIYKIYKACVKLSQICLQHPGKHIFGHVRIPRIYIFSHGKMFNNQTGLIDSLYSTCLQIRRWFKSQSCPSLFLSFTSRMGFRLLSKIQTYKIYMVLRTLRINKPQNCLANKILFGNCIVTQTIRLLKDGLVNLKFLTANFSLQDFRLIAPEI